jgi:hypothetical protein
MHYGTCGERYSNNSASATIVVRQFRITLIGTVPVIALRMLPDPSVARIID